VFHLSSNKFIGTEMQLLGERDAVVGRKSKGQTACVQNVINTEALLFWHFQVKQLT
jgi:hypothetical protein